MKEEYFMSREYIYRYSIKYLKFEENFQQMRYKPLRTIEDRTYLLITY